MVAEEQGIMVLFYSGWWFALDKSNELDIMWREMNIAPSERFEEVGMEDSLVELMSYGQPDRDVWTYANIPLSLAEVKRLIYHRLGISGYYYNGHTIIWWDNQWVKEIENVSRCEIVSRDLIEDVLVNIHQYF